jgi:hypothetical protein
MVKFAKSDGGPMVDVGERKGVAVPRAKGPAIGKLCLSCTSTSRNFQRQTADRKAEQKKTQHNWWEKTKENGRGMEKKRGV